MLPEALLHDLSPMDRGIVILGYVRAIRKEKKFHGWKNLVIQYIQVVVSFWAHNVDEPRPDQLKQPQIMTLPPQACTVGLSMMGAGWVDPVPLERGKSRLIRPHDLFPLLLRQIESFSFFTISLTDK